MPGSLENTSRHNSYGCSLRPRFYEYNFCQFSTITDKNSLGSKLNIRKTKLNVKHKGPHDMGCFLQSSKGLPNLILWITSYDLFTLQDQYQTPRIFWSPFLLISIPGQVCPFTSELISPIDSLIENFPVFCPIPKPCIERDDTLSHKCKRPSTDLPTSL